MLTVPPHNREDLLLIAFEEGFKRLFVSALSGNYEDLFCGGIICFVVHAVLSISASQSQAQIFNSPSCYAADKGKALTKLAGS